MKIILFAVCGISTSLWSINAEYASLYKDPRIMSMGGANIVVGSYSSSVFMNPAGLMQIPSKEGFVIDFLNTTLSTSEKFQNFYDDFNNAPTNSQKSELLTKYSGEHFHIGVESYFSISKRKGNFVGTIGILSAVDGNFMTHGNGSRAGNFLETTSRAYGGIILGGAMLFDTKYGRLDMGVSLKVIRNYSYEGTLGLNQFTNNAEDFTALIEELRDKYETINTGIGVDLGVIYHLEINEKMNRLKPTVGVSILNIGSIGFDAFGGQPLTVNLGASITPIIPHIEKLVIAIDYVDLFNANKLRVFGATGADNKVVYTDFDESSFMKRFRIGTSLHLVDNSLLTFILNAGLYQSEFTTGVDMRLGFININATTYAEEVGTTNYSIIDRRYMVKLGLAW